MVASAGWCSAALPLPLKSSDWVGSVAPLPDMVAVFFVLLGGTSRGSSCFVSTNELDCASSEMLLFVFCCCEEQVSGGGGEGREAETRLVHKRGVVKSGRLQEELRRCEARQQLWAVAAAEARGPATAQVGWARGSWPRPAHWEGSSKVSYTLFPATLNAQSQVTHTSSTTYLLDQKCRSPDRSG